MAALSSLSANPLSREGRHGRRYRVSRYHDMILMVFCLFADAGARRRQAGAEAQVQEVRPFDRGDGGHSAEPGRSW